MKYSIRLNLAFLLLCVIIDALVMSFFPVDYTFTRYQFTAGISVMFLTLIILEDDLQSVIIYTLSLGILQDIMTFRGIGIHTLSLLATALFLYYWSKRLSQTLLEVVLMLMMALFFNGVVTYGLAWFQGLVTYSFIIYVSRVLFFTVVVNLLFAFIVFWLNRKKKRLLARHEQQLRRSERSLHYKP